MSKKLLKNKDLIPTKFMLERILGNHFKKYQYILQQLSRRQLFPEMYWYGPSSGWAPRFCIGEITICGIYLAQNPLMGLIGIGHKIGVHLDEDIKLNPRSRILYKMAIKKGPLKWIEAKLITNQEIDVFLSLIDGKLRSLLKLGIKIKSTKNKSIDVSKQNDGDLCKTVKKNGVLVNVGPSRIYSIKTIFASGKG